LDQEQKDFCEKILKIIDPKDLFGGILYQGKKEIISCYRSFLFILHPDKCNPMTSKEQELSNEAFRHLTELKDLVLFCLDNNIPFKRMDKNESIFKINDKTYHILKHMIEGDFSNIYLCDREYHTGAKIKVCMKVSKDSNDLILHEKEMLIHIQKNLNPLSFPVYLDHFKFSDDSLANVTKYIEGFDFCTLQNFYTEGISVSNAVWILERILSACGNLHSKLIIHGLIEPSNLIVTHYNHNVTIIDFCGAIQDANSNDAKYSLLNDFSAPEITKDLSPHPRTDLFSIGKSMIYLLSGNNENNYQKNIKDYPDFDSLIQKMVESNPKKRSDDCFQEWEKLEKIRTKYFGPDRFRDFLDKVPGKGI